MKKLILLFIFILIISISFVSAKVWDGVTIGQGDTRWCRLYGNCVIKSLNVTGNTTINNIVNWNVTGNITADYYCDDTGCYSIPDFFDDTITNCSVLGVCSDLCYMDYANTGNLNVSGNVTADYYFGNGTSINSLTHSLDDAYDDGSVIQVDDTDVVFNLSNDKYIVLKDAEDAIDDFFISEVGNEWIIDGEKGDTDTNTLVLATGVERHIVMGLNSTGGTFADIDIGCGSLVTLRGTLNITEDLDVTGIVSGDGRGLTDLSHSLQQAYEVDGDLNFSEDTFWEVYAEQAETTTFRINTSGLGARYIIFDATSLTSEIIFRQEGTDILRIAAGAQPVGLRTSNWIPFADDTYDLGAIDTGVGDFRWRDLHLAGTIKGTGSGESIYMNASIGDVRFGYGNFNITNNGTVVTSKSITAHGNITVGEYLINDSGVKFTLTELNTTTTDTNETDRVNDLVTENQTLHSKVDSMPNISLSDVSSNVGNFSAWNNLTGIPHATPSDGDVTHFSLADEIYDWVVGFVYATKAYVDSLGNWSADKSSLPNLSLSDISSNLGNYSTGETNLSTSYGWVTTNGTTAMLDTNTTTACSSDQVLLANGSCYDIIGTEWITPAEVLDIDKEDIESDLNTFVDIAGDTMTGDLNISGKLNVTGNSTIAGFHFDKVNSTHWKMWVG